MGAIKRTAGKREVRRYRKLRARASRKKSPDYLEAIRQNYALPIDARSRADVLHYLATHAYMQSFVVAVSDEILRQFAQCHNDPVLKLDIIDGCRVIIVIDAEVLSAEADARLDAVRDWVDDALITLSAIHFDTE